MLQTDPNLGIVDIFVASLFNGRTMKTTFVICDLPSKIFFDLTEILRGKMEYHLKNILIQYRVPLYE